jgi:hypothetical protein
MTTGGGARCVVLDTNVLAVAEGLHGGASEACRLACIELVKLVEGGLPVAVDSFDEIVSEYVGALRGSGTAGLGVKVAQRLYRLRRDRGVCHVVDVTRVDGPPRSFEEVPEALRDFDDDDHKFIAVAAAEACQPQIYTAVDAEWWQRRQDFADASIDVQFLCAGDFLNRGS